MTKATNELANKELKPLLGGAAKNVGKIDKTDDPAKIGKIVQTRKESIKKMIPITENEKLKNFLKEAGELLGKVHGKVTKKQIDDIDAQLNEKLKKVFE